MEWAWSGLTGQGSGLTGQAKALACQAGLTGRLAYGSLNYPVVGVWVERANRSQESTHTQFTLVANVIGSMKTFVCICIVVTEHLGGLVSGLNELVDGKI